MTDEPGSLQRRVASPADDADRAVLERIVAGDLHALEELYDRYRTMAYSIAYRITNDATLAEDVVQDAFLGAWRNAARYVEGRGSVKTWLLSIVHHRAIDAIRRRKPTSELPEREDVPPTELRLPDIWAEVSANLDAEAVRGAMAVLSDVQREAIELAYFGGLTQQEIASPDGHAARDREEPDAPRAARDAPRAHRRRPRGAGGRHRGRQHPRRRGTMSDEMRATDLTCDDVREMAGSFVLGALDPAEDAAVRAHLATCDDAHAEIAEAGSVLPVLLESVPVVEPSAALKGRILAAAAADLEGQSTPPAAAPAVAEAAPSLAPASTVSEPIPFPTEADASGARPRPRRRARPRRSPGCCGSRPWWGSWRSSAGTCCSRTS